jgi:hypothetical protein
MDGEDNNGLRNGPDKRSEDRPNRSRIAFRQLQAMKSNQFP